MKYFEVIAKCGHVGKNKCIFITFACAAEIFEFLKEKMSGEYRDVPILSFGPFEAPVYKLDDSYRMRVVLKCRRSKKLLAMLAELVAHFTSAKYKTVSCGVDINPTNI